VFHGLQLKASTHEALRTSNEREKKGGRTSIIGNLEGQMVGWKGSLVNHKQHRVRRGRARGIKSTEDVAKDKGASACEPALLVNILSTGDRGVRNQ